MEHYLIVSSIMFFVGIYGFIARKNLLFSLFGIAISAAETAVAIAIIINVYRLANNIDVRHIDKMKY